MSFVNISLSDKKYDEISALIRKSYPDACILWINRVENPGLKDRYEKRRKAIVDKCGSVKELQLFHGTSFKNITSIAESGFDPSYNKRSSVGVGTYFATAAQYSVGYTDGTDSGISYMFVCDVLIGICGQLFGHIDTNQYDASVNDVNNPTMYVVPYNDAAFPSYVVAFYKYADNGPRIKRRR